MARSLSFAPKAWEQYLWWYGEKKTTFEKLNELINDCRRDPWHGIGKPEPLKGGLKGYWSRRITDEHRLVYGVYSTDKEDVIAVLQCRYHYDK